MAAPSAEDVATLVRELEEAQEAIDRVLEAGKWRPCARRTARLTQTACDAGTESGVYDADVLADLTEEACRTAVVAASVAGLAAAAVARDPAAFRGRTRQVPEQSSQEPKYDPARALGSRDEDARGGGLAVEEESGSSSSDDGTLGPPAITTVSPGPVDPDSREEDRLAGDSDARAATADGAAPRPESPDTAPTDPSHGSETARLRLPRGHTQNHGARARGGARPEPSPDAQPEGTASSGMGGEGALQAASTAGDPPTSLSAPALAVRDRLMQGPGVRVIKHGRFGRPKEQLLRLSSDGGALQWGSRKGARFPLYRLCSVLEGKHTAVFRRGRAGAADDSRCLSLVTRNRTLDVEVKRGEDKAPLLEWLQSVVPAKGVVG